MAVDQGGDAGRIVAAVFEPPQPLDQLGGDRFVRDNSNDAAHYFLLPAKPMPQFRRRPGLLTCGAARDRQRIRRHVAGDDAAGGDDRAVADRDRRHQRRVRADKRALADNRAELVKAVVIAGDRAGADIGAGADVAVAEIGEVVGLGPGAEPGRLDLDEIADMHVALEHRAGTQPRVRADDRALGDRRAVEMRERADADVVARRVTPGPKTTFGSTTTSRPSTRVGREKHRLRRDQGRSRRHRAAAQAVLHQRLGLGQLGAGVDPEHLLAPAARRCGTASPRPRAMSTMSVR